MANNVAKGKIQYDMVNVHVLDENGKLMRVLPMERYTATMFAAFQSIHTNTSIVIVEQ